jgi:hypothetical protein
VIVVAILATEVAVGMESTPMSTQVPVRLYHLWEQPRPERQSERFNMKASPEFLARLDEWRREQPDLPNRSEAIRRLVEIAMRKSGNTGGRCKSSTTVQP